MHRPLHTRHQEAGLRDTWPVRDHGLHLNSGLGGQRRRPHKWGVRWLPTPPTPIITAGSLLTAHRGREDREPSRQGARDTPHAGGELLWARARGTRGRVQRAALSRVPEPWWAPPCIHLLSLVASVPKSPLCTDSYTPCKGQHAGAPVGWSFWALGMPAPGPSGQEFGFQAAPPLPWKGAERTLGRACEGSPGPP